ncbi:MAG: hypothetical protein ABI337_04130 [Nitrososphaera sp.]
MNVINQNMQRSKTTKSRYVNQEQICKKCGGIHDSILEIWDRNEYKLIDTIEQIRAKHRIKVVQWVRSYLEDEPHYTKIKYLDM